MAKKKLTLKDLAPQPYTFNLVHPLHGELDASITMVGPESLEFIQSSAKLAKQSGALKLEDMEAEDILSYTASIYAPLVKGWDEEFFGEYTQDNVLSVFSNVENQWIVKLIEDVFSEKEHFFMK